MNEGCRGKSRAPHASQRRPPARRRRAAALDPRAAFAVADLLAQMPFIRAIRGRMGGMVFKTYGRKIIVTRMPTFAGYVPSAAQRARRDRMRAATAYAQHIYAHPTAKAFYVAAAKELHRHPFRLAVSDYLTAHPRVTQVAALCPPPHRPSFAPITGLRHSSSTLRGESAVRAGEVIHLPADDTASSGRRGFARDFPYRKRNRLAFVRRKRVAHDNTASAALAGNDSVQNGSPIFTPRIYGRRFNSRISRQLFSNCPRTEFQRITLLGKEMIRADHQRRFEQALASKKPSESLRHLAITLREEGTSQIDVYFLFERYQEKTSGDDPLYDAIVDTMDEIHGGALAKGGGFFSTTLTDEIIRAERKNA